MPLNNNIHTVSARDAVFKQNSEGITPDDSKETLKGRLKPWRPQIRAYRRKGYSWDQLASIVAKPGIEIAIKGSTLRKLLGGRRKGTG